MVQEPEGRAGRPPSSSVATWVATVTGNAFLLFGTAALGTLALLIGWIPPRGHLVYPVARLWSRGLLAASGVRLEARFEEPLAPGDRFVFMSNHQSLLDIPALLATLPGQTRFLAKASLFRIPIFGWAIKLGGFVSIDRKDRSSARESFSSAVDQLRKGASTLVFPEGTRSPDGRLLPFQRGGFLLALKSGLPIVPVAVDGSLAVRRRGALRTSPGTIRLRYGRPLDTRDYGLRGKDRLMAEVRRRILELGLTSVAAQDP